MSKEEVQPSSPSPDSCEVRITTKPAQNQSKPSSESEHARAGDYGATGHDVYSAGDYIGDDYIQWTVEHAGNVTKRRNKAKKSRKSAKVRSSESMNNGDRAAGIESEGPSNVLTLSAMSKCGSMEEGSGENSQAVSRLGMEQELSPRGCLQLGIVHPPCTILVDHISGGKSVEMDQRRVGKVSFLPLVTSTREKNKNKAPMRSVEEAEEGRQPAIRDHVERGGKSVNNGDRVAGIKSEGPNNVITLRAMSKCCSMEEGSGENSQAVSQLGREQALSPHVCLQLGTVHQPCTSLADQISGEKTVEMDQRRVGKVVVLPLATCIREKAENKAPMRSVEEAKEGRQPAIRDHVERGEKSVNNDNRVEGIESEGPNNVLTLRAMAKCGSMEEGNRENSQAVSQLGREQELSPHGCLQLGTVHPPCTSTIDFSNK